MSKPNHISCNCCSGVVNTENHFVRVDERLFCSNDCAMEYVAQAQRLENACDSFSPKIHVNKKWWGSNQPLAGVTNPEDM